MSDPREDDMACGVVGLGEWWRRGWENIMGGDKGKIVGNKTT